MAHTAELDSATLRSARALLDGAFGPEMRDVDWEHALGGIHALAWEQGEVVGHGAVVMRQLMHRGRVLRTGYVEGVAVRADRRRQGIGGAVMAAVEKVIRSAYELGALGATEEGAALYEARGWQRWRGRTWALSPQGLIRTPGDDDDTYVLPVTAQLDVLGELACDWREGDPW